MNRDTQLQVQAYLDNELGSGDARTISKLISSDVAARKLYNELKETREALVQNEPEFQVPDSREFYWSQIQRRIDSAQRVPSSAPVRPWWMRMLVPMAGAVGLFAVLISVVNKDGGQPTVVTSNLPAAIAPLHSVQQSADVSQFTFRSESEGVTLVWLSHQ